MLLIIAACICHAKFLLAQDVPAVNKPLVFEVADSLLTKEDSIQNGDSARVMTDSMIAGSQEADLEFPVDYAASDSIVYDVEGKKVFLYGDAKVSYDDITLNAAFIEFGFSSNEVSAHGMPDSSGTIAGKPVFTDGDQEFEAGSIRYNFDSKKGLIKDVVTEEEEGFLHSAVTKRHENEEIHIKKAKYTTCDKENPHYHFRLSKAVVIPDKKIVSGPGYMVIGKVPTPLGIPFGFFPNKSGGASGIILPALGTNPQYGVSLIGLGYYFPVKDRISQTFLTDIYSRGSWALRSETQYKNIYRNQGDLKLSYAQYVTGLKELPDYAKSKQFFINWNHAMDPKAKPSHSFRANVNAGTSDNFTASPNASTTDFVTNTFNSSINYGKQFGSSPFNLNVGLNHNQNSINKTHNFTLPDAVLNMNRFNLPLGFLKREPGGSKKWFEKIGVSGSTNAKGILSAHESSLRANNVDSLTSAIRPGVLTNLRAQTSIKAWYFNINPSANYTERWHWDYIQQRYDTAFTNNLAVDTLKGFNTGRDYNFAIGTSTKLFGMYNPIFGPVQTIRHVMTPTVSFKYFPDLTHQNSIYMDGNGEEKEYSAMQNGVFGAPSLSNQALLDFRVVNNVELKLKKTKGDSAKTNKVSLIDNFTFGSFYNFLADSIKWSEVALAGQTSVGKFLRVTYRGTFDPYEYDDKGNVLDRSMWAESRKLGRFNYTQLGLTTTINQNSFGPDRKKDMDNDEEENPKVQYFNAWNVDLGYNMGRTKYPTRNIALVDSISTVRAISLNAGAAITEKWDVSVSTGYDLEAKDLTLTSININRDLHCWQLGVNIVPFGAIQRITVRFGFVASMLQDVKIERDWQRYNQ